MAKRSSYKLTNTNPYQIFSLDWIPKALIVDNTSPFPVYINIGAVNIPTIRSASDILPPFTHYTTDPAGAHDFVIFIDNTTDPAQVFPFPVVVSFISGYASQQSFLSLGIPESF